VFNGILVVLFSVDTIARQAKPRATSVDDRKSFLEYFVGTRNRTEMVERFPRYDFFTRFRERTICRSCVAGLIVNDRESVTHFCRAFDRLQLIELRAREDFANPTRHRGRHPAFPRWVGLERRWE
jgi:hypothetical protein